MMSRVWYASVLLAYLKGGAAYRDVQETVSGAAIAMSLRKE